MPTTANRTANFDTLGNLNLTVPHTVYTRTRWANPWVAAPNLWCNQAVWALQPGTSHAELQWNYGRGKQVDRGQLERILPDAGSRRYVKVVWNNATNLIEGATPISPTWYGMVNGLGDNLGGTRQMVVTGDDGDPTLVSYETGQQSLQCVGLEKLLDDTIVKTSAWVDETGNRYFIDRGLEPNLPGPDGEVGENMANYSNWVENLPLFAGFNQTPIPWSTREYLQYLIKYHRPVDRGGTPLPMALDPSGLALDLIASGNDRPHFKTHGRSVRELLNQLLPYQRFLTWKLEVDETFNAIFIVLVSLTAENITLPGNGFGGDTILANPNRFSLDIDQSRLASVLTLSHAESVDRVRVQGARGTSTFTISNADGTLVEGYDSGVKAKYDAGAIGTALGTAAAGKYDRLRKLTANVRSSDALKWVYSRLRIVADWDGVAKNGEGAAPGNFWQPVETETPNYKFYPRELWLLPDLPLKDGFKYEDLGGSNPLLRTAPTTISTQGPHNRLAPIVLIQIPASGIDASADAVTKRWTHVEKIHLAGLIEQTPGDADFTWSASVHIPRQDRAIVVNVSGAPQWVIAGSDYTYASTKDAKSLGKWDWKTIIATVCAEWDAHCEGFWPPRGALPDNDYLREVILDAGDHYRLDWLVPGTVLGLANLTDDVGQLRRTTLGGWIQDDRAKLTDRARMAYAWYGVERRAIQISSPLINGTIKVGDMIAELGSTITRTVNTVVTAVAITCPPAPLGGVPPLPMISITTDYVAELDLFLSPNIAAAAKAVTPAAAAALPAGSAGTDTSKHPAFAPPSAADGFRFGGMLQAAAQDHARRSGHAGNTDPFLPPAFRQ